MPVTVSLILMPVSCASMSVTSVLRIAASPLTSAPEFGSTSSSAASSRSVALMPVMLSGVCAAVVASIVMPSVPVASRLAPTMRAVTSLATSLNANAMPMENDSDDLPETAAETAAAPTSELMLLESCALISASVTTISVPFPVTSAIAPPAMRLRAAEPPAAIARAFAVEPARATAAAAAVALMACDASAVTLSVAVDVKGVVTLSTEASADAPPVRARSKRSHRLVSE